MYHQVYGKSSFLHIQEEALTLIKSQSFEITEISE